MSQDTPTAYCRRYTVSPLDGYTTFRHNLEVWAVNSAGRRLSLEAKLTLLPNLEDEEKTIDREQRLAEVRFACPNHDDSDDDRKEASRRLRALTWLAADLGLRDFGPSRPIA